MLPLDALDALSWCPLGAMATAQVKGEVRGDQKKPGGRTPHDGRLEEKRADEFQDVVMKEVKATRKTEKQRRRVEKRRQKGREE
jgi:hypothetical protein